MSSNNELHVIFGTGPLGSAVMRELVRQGKRVRMVNRQGKADEVLTEVEVVKGDATDPANVRQVCQGATVVYLCAQPAYNRWAEDFPPIMSGLIEGVAAVDAKLVFGDNLYMYGEVNGPISENLPYAAQTHKGQARASLANMLMQAHQSGKIRATIGRGADFYGPQVLDSTLGSRVFYPALAGKSAGAIGNLDLPHTYTYIGDFGRGLVTLGAHQEALGQTWHIPDPPTITTRQLLNIMFEELGQPPKMSGMGKTMLRIAGLFIPGARETVELMYEFEKPFVVDHSKFERAFGANPTPHRETMHCTVEWYRKHPKTH